MVFKSSAPKEDPETKARRKLAEKRAEAGRLDELGNLTKSDTANIIRQFGRLGGQSLASGSVGGGGGGFGGASNSLSSIIAGSIGGARTTDVIKSLVLK